MTTPLIDENTEETTTDTALDKLLRESGVLSSNIFEDEEIQDAVDTHHECMREISIKTYIFENLGHFLYYKILNSTKISVY